MGQELYIRVIKAIPEEGIQSGTPVARVGETIKVMDMGTVYHHIVSTASNTFGYCIPLECGMQMNNPNN
jgi:hypothetical protein